MTEVVMDRPLRIDSLHNAGDDCIGLHTVLSRFALASCIMVQSNDAISALTRSLGHYPQRSLIKPFIAETNDWWQAAVMLVEKDHLLRVGDSLIDEIKN